MDTSMRTQVRDFLAKLGQRLMPGPGLRPAELTVRTSWLLLADGRPSLHPVRRSR